jgi:hypothetical protein
MAHTNDPGQVGACATRNLIYRLFCTMLSPLCWNTIISMKALGASFVAVTLVVLAAVPAVAAAPSPHVLVITPDDASQVYGGDFLLEAGSTVTNSQANIIPSGYLQPPSSVYARHGRITGYLTFLSRSRSERGPTQIFCDVDRYRTSAGPRWAVQYSGAMKGPARTGVTVVSRSVHGIGNAAYLAKYNHPSSSTASTVLVLAFRRGNYLVTIGVSGETRLSVNAVVRMARIVDHRITAQT